MGRFSKDLKWLVRLQKTGSGESSLYLYRRAPQAFVAATKEPLGPGMGPPEDSSRVAKGQEGPRVSLSAGLLKGTEENYRWLGVDWP
jgi:hypothetical protein